MPIRILIADDFQLLREDLRDTLSAQEDMEVVGMAASGQEICALAERTDFDILLMDIEMESLKAGIEATEVIMSDKPDAKIISSPPMKPRRWCSLPWGRGRWIIW